WNCPSCSRHQDTPAPATLPACADRRRQCLYPCLRRNHSTLSRRTQNSRGCGRNHGCHANFIWTGESVAGRGRRAPSETGIGPRIQLIVTPVGNIEAEHLPRDLQVDQAATMKPVVDLVELLLQQGQVMLLDALQRWLG